MASAISALVIGGIIARSMADYVGVDQATMYRQRFLLHPLAEVADANGKAGSFADRSNGTMGLRDWLISSFCR
jgi:hypothetical protein